MIARLLRLLKKKPTAQPEWPRVWHALPGNVMEFGATGWQVKLELCGAVDGSRRDSFLVINPEGDALIRIWGGNGPLEEAKRYAEQACSEREAFAARTQSVESLAAQIIQRCKG